MLCILASKIRQKQQAVRHFNEKKCRLKQYTHAHGNGISPHHKRVKAMDVCPCPCKCIYGF